MVICSILFDTCILILKTSKSGTILQSCRIAGSKKRKNTLHSNIVQWHDLSDEWRECFCMIDVWLSLENNKQLYNRSAKYNSIIKVQGMNRDEKNRVEKWESDVNRVEVICLSYFFIIIYDYLLLLFCCFRSKVHVEYHPRCELLRINRCSKHV